MQGLHSARTFATLFTKMAEHTPRPTTREIAAHLGISHNTVARALRNAPRVSAQTCALVQQTAQQMGYRPNPLVSALMADRRRSAAARHSGEVLCYLTVSDEEEQWLRVPSLIDQFSGSRERASALGFDLQHMWLGPKGCNARQVSRVMKARGIRGALLAPTAWGDESPLQMDWQSFSCVMIGNNEQPVSLSRTIHNSSHIIGLCHQQLRQAGCQRIGLALPPMHKQRENTMVSGFLGQQWYHRDSVRQIPPLIFTTDQKDRLLRWVEKHRLDAVIGIWPDFPLKWLREHGLKVPRDICYATLDLADLNPQIAGIMQDNVTLGRTAINLLVTQLFSNEIGPPASPITTMVKCNWRGGPTVTSRQPEPRKQPEPRRQVKPTHAANRKA